MEEALCERSGHKVSIDQPRRGARAKLIEQASRNAEEALDRRMAETSSQAKVLRELADTFELPDVPKRIEVYDNSHIMGTNATGAMIVAGPEGFRKNSYRKFNIKSGVTPGRRFRDDARGARSAVRAAGEGRPRPLERRMAGPAADRRRQGPIVGGVRDPGECRRPRRPGGRRRPRVRDRNAGRETFHLPGGREMTLPPNSALLFYLQRLRDEAHRFAIGTHRAKRSKSLTTSTLDEVPGIGPNRKRALLMHFGTARAVKGAALDDLERAPGISKAMARQLYDYFHPRG